MSPGPLSQPHAQLEGDRHCEDCHRSGRQVVAAQCLACHRDLGRKVAAGTGLHGRAYRGQACEGCHVEHISRKNPLVRWPGGAPERLDHAQTGWSLEGDHRTTNCRACHTQVTPQGRPTYIAAKPACASCHTDPHRGRFSTNCRACHDLEDWRRFDQKAFDHRLARFPLVGKHAEVACAGCHRTPSQWTGLAFQTCDSCHRDPHRGSFAPRACSECHEPTGWSRAAEQMRSDHPGLSLRNGHARVACQACHDQGNSKPPRAGKRCVDCHAPVHDAGFGPRCESCHRSIQWLGLPKAIGRDAHGQTAYPLVGRHLAADCAGCHPAKLPVAERFRGLRFERCGDCHGDRHRGEFLSRDAGECGACHTVAGFAPTTFGPAAHATTSFALEGKHAATPCRGCHPGAAPRLDWRQPHRACAECHADPHRGQFAKEMQSGGCGACHTSGDWRRPRVDHSTWPLTGGHREVACVRCHGGRGTAEATYRGVPRECDGCHDDVHAGQFRASEPIRPCAGCHDSEGFSVPAFDHARLAGYPIEGKHVGLACARCHPITELRNGVSAVRYRLGYRACKDCHANPHRAPGAR